MCCRIRFLILAADYDGTLARDGRVSTDTLAAMERLVASGRRLVLVTGRELDDLRSVFPDLRIFERVVAENGAVMHTPASGETRPLAAEPPPAFLDALAARGVPFSRGLVVVATRRPHETQVVEAIADAGADLHVTFNKGAVMVLPTGVHKGTGLTAALDELRLSPHNVVGVGDAENDNAFLELCERSVAVANALPLVKERADWTTTGERGQGVEELIEALLRDDLAAVSPRPDPPPAGGGR